MSPSDQSKQIINSFVDAVWRHGDLSRLPEFWTAECLNHAAAAGQQQGLEALRTYHQNFAATFAAFTDVHIEVIQQVAEGDRVVTHMVTHGKHTGLFMGIEPTGRAVYLASIRIDRLENGKIAEHWSVAATAELMAQMQ